MYMSKIFTQEAIEQEREEYISTLETENASFKSENSFLKTEYASVKDENNSLKTDNAAKARRIEELEKKLAEERAKKK